MVDKQKLTVTLTLEKVVEEPAKLDLLQMGGFLSPLFTLLYL